METAIISAASSFIGAWLAAQFAFQRFSREKVWERKAAAYTAIFEALHYIGRWYDKHYEAELVKKELSEETKAELKSEANKAEAELERRLASETWLIPEKSRQRLAQLTTNLKGRKYDSWFEFLDAGSFEISSATNDMRNLVQNDLGLRRRYTRRNLFRLWLVGAAVWIGACAWHLDFSCFFGSYPWCEWKVVNPIFSSWYIEILATTFGVPVAVLVIGMATLWATKTGRGDLARLAD